MNISPDVADGCQIDSRAWACVMALAHPVFSETTVTHLHEQLSTDIDQSVFWELVTRHRLTPLVIDRITRVLPAWTTTLLPDDWAAIQVSYTERLQRQRTALGHVMQRLTQVGIPALAYKGPLLTQLLYGDAALRHSSDLDVLIRKADLDGIMKVLREDGFLREDNGMVEHVEAWVRRYGNEFMFYHPETDIKIEPHWLCLPPVLRMPLAFDEVWARHASVTFNGYKIPSVSHEDHALLLCLNVAKDFLMTEIKLKALSDVARFLVAGPAVEWEWITAEARRLGVLRLLGITLSAVHRAWEVPIPAPVCAVLEQDRHIHELTNELLLTFPAGQPPTPTFDTRVARELQILRSRERWQDQLFRVGMNVRFMAQLLVANPYIGRTYWRNLRWRSRWHWWRALLKDLSFYLLWPLWRPICAVLALWRSLTGNHSSGAVSTEMGKDQR